MGKAGRKRKPGKRTASGRLSRAGISPFDYGTERARALVALYGQHGTEALGRAYAAGLLGHKDDPRALERYRNGQVMAHEWRKHFQPGYRCALNDNPRGSDDYAESGAQQRRYHWMLRETRALDAAGFGSWFHQLVLAHNPTSGPEWLDRLLAGVAGEGERRILELNIKALDSLDMALDKA